ncbi:MAG: Hsp20/alpha crystallin family protein [Candidatus Binataceae bacterium]
MPKFLAPSGGDFQRVFDELFDELLIDRWHVPASEKEPAVVLERPNAYEVRLCTGAFKPSEVNLEVSEHRLTARARRGDNLWERLLTFTDAIETEKVTAKWANRILTVLLPKQTKRPRSRRK